MMDFDQIVVKESPGLCRCCLSEGCYKDLGTEYAWMSDTEVYADMLLECFDISITQHNEGPNGPNRLICEVCITRLRDACNFKKQVMESEKKFIDMVGRGEFRPKVLIYQGQMKSEEQIDEVADEPEVEYLDDEMTFGDGDITKEEPGESSTYEDVTVSTLPVKGKRGRPRKNVAAANSEKKAKVAKTEEKPRTSKAVAKGVEIKKEKRTSYFEKLCSIRRNITIVLRYGNVLPFTWTTKGFRCFYCSKQMRDCDILKAHTISKHASVDYNSFIPKRIITKDIPVKVDVTNFSCKECPEIILTTLDDLITHIAGIHGEPYDFSTGVCLFPFVLKKDLMSCVICEESYDNFTCMIGHMYKRHITHGFMCQKCGLSFIDQARLNRHMHGSHMDHQCTICGKNFVAFHKLDKHKKLIHGLVKSSHVVCAARFLRQITK